MFEWTHRALRNVSRALDFDVEFSCPLDGAGGGSGGLGPGPGPGPGGPGYPSSSSSSSRRRDIVLLKHDEAPEFLRGNPFVVSGYRSTLPFSLCLKSLFIWSNDSVNIWTHLIGFLIFFALMIRDNVIPIYYHGSGWHHFWDHTVVTAGLLCFQAYRCWLSLDLTGILIGLLGCYIPGIHFAFYCTTIWRDVYLFIFGVLFLSVFYYQAGTHHCMSPKWFQLRILLFVLLSAGGIIPAVHWICMNGGFEAKIVQALAPKVLVVYLLGLAAFFFYITQFPERCFPGKFDFIGASHQVWHVIIVILFLWWHQSGEDLVLYYKDHPCSS